MEYSYTSIREDEIRLLRPVGKSFERLDFEVLSIARRWAPAFTAVSYTWGDDQPSQWIHLDGKPFHVRLNLWSCLYYLSLATRHRRWGYIWVDAICIDQANNVERNIQVRLMEITYREAACVSVWLGLVPRTVAFEYDGPIKTFEIDPFIWADHMLDLANRPYWSRVWVIQEFLLNQNIQLYCSDNCIEWLDFQDLLGFESGVDFLTPQPAAHAQHEATQKYAATSLLLSRRLDGLPDFFQPLHRLLLDHRTSTCRDPRDRVFALMGLVTPLERRWLSRFFPDYRLSMDVVALLALAHSKSFRDDDVINDNDLLQTLGVCSRQEKHVIMKVLRSVDYLGSISLLLLQDDIDRLKTKQSSEKGRVIRSDNAVEATKLDDDNAGVSMTYLGVAGVAVGLAVGTVRKLFMW